MLICIRDSRTFCCCTFLCLFYADETGNALFMSDLFCLNRFIPHIKKHAYLVDWRHLIGSKCECERCVSCNGQATQPGCIPNSGLQHPWDAESPEYRWHLAHLSCSLSLFPTVFIWWEEAYTHSLLSFPPSLLEVIYTSLDYSDFDLLFELSSTIWTFSKIRIIAWFCLIHSK